jgi:hypothetical protein
MLPLSLPLLPQLTELTYQQICTQPKTGMQSRVLFSLYFVASSRSKMILLRLSCDIPSLLSLSLFNTLFFKRSLAPSTPLVFDLLLMEATVLTCPNLSQLSSLRKLTLSSCFLDPFLASLHVLSRLSNLVCYNASLCDAPLLALLPVSLRGTQVLVFSPPLCSHSDSDEQFPMCRMQLLPFRN